MIRNLRITSLIILSLSLILSSCDKDMSISLKNENIDNLNLTSSDTLSAVVSTVLLPNIPTNGTGNTSDRILVGKVSQGPVGSLTSSSYFTLYPGDVTSDIPTSAKFDSLTLVLRPSAGRYTYGDTTKVQTIVAHRVIQTLEKTTLNNNMTGIPNPIYVSGPSIFGHQKFAYDNNALGAVSFTPRMSKRDSVVIRLNDALGTELFNKIRTSDYVFNSVANFQEYFKGLVLVPSPDNSAMIGFSDTLTVKVNYSYRGDDGFKKSDSKTLQMGDRSLQYNHFQADRTGTAFENLDSKKEIPSAQTSGVTFLQAGSGVGAKITFPGLAEFMQTGNIAINKAELIIEVASKEVGPYVAGRNPILFIATDNVPTSFVNIPFQAGIQNGAYIIGNNTGRNGKYVFDMIQYIRTANDENAKNKSLFLSLGSSELFNSSFTSILATENNKPKIKLNIVYTKF